MESVILIIQL